MVDLRVVVVLGENTASVGLELGSGVNTTADGATLEDLSLHLMDARERSVVTDFVELLSLDRVAGTVGLAGTTGVDRLSQDQGRSRVHRSSIGRTADAPRGGDGSRREPVSSSEALLAMGRNKSQQIPSCGHAGTCA